MPSSLEDTTWEILIARINDGRCTPFLGAGACHGVLPLGADVALKWAAEFKYPFPDSSDLVKVAQYVALNKDPMTPKERILKILEREVKPPNFKDPLQPHRLLAELNLPIYLTTNYDNLMVEALKFRHKDPKRELCRWNQQVRKHPSIFDKQPEFKPTVPNPVVFHLHGHDEAVNSLVLTEDDYMDFLVNISSKTNLIPPVIRDALSGTTLLFIGYKVVDWSFRVLMRSISRFMEKGQRRISVAVMLPPRAEELSPPSAVESSAEKAQEYLNKYYENIDIRVYWGTVQEFVAELRKRMVEMGDGN